MGKKDRELKDTLQSIDDTLKRIEAILLDSDRNAKDYYGCAFSGNNTEKIYRNITFP